MAKLEHSGTIIGKGEEIYRALVEKATDGLYMVDADSGRILFSNPYFAVMFGYTTEDMEGMNFLDLHCPEDRDRAKGVLKRVVHGERVVEEFRTEVL